MDYYTWILVVGSLLFGLAVGSFIAARVLRTTKNVPQNLLGRSQCMSCKKTLTMQDLVPVFSYLFLRGRCRHCKQPFSATYMIIELTTALLFMIFMAVGLTQSLFPMPLETASTMTFFLHVGLGLLTLSTLIYVTALDIQIMAFPVRALGTLTVIHLLVTAYGSFVSGNAAMLMSALLGGLLFAGTLAIIRILGTLLRGVEAMGEGDLWIAGLIGVSLGLNSTIVAFYATFILGAIAAIMLLIQKRKSSQPAVLPFAPFLTMGWFIGYLWGAPLFALLFPL